MKIEETLLNMILWLNGWWCRRKLKRMIPRLSFMVEQHMLRISSVRQFLIEWRRPQWGNDALDGAMFQFCLSPLCLFARINNYRRGGG